MVVIDVKLSETLHIGDDIEVKVCQIDRAEAKLGIAAPREVVIVRKELIEDTPCLYKKHTNN
ncbi:carbon storage regulator CsrA [Simiduia litorea]|uniref:carbon storage regulator n=1 Tax=Simiduia litorea TaxID=1435348 RepID=UPI0036F42BA2